jgi:two-component system, NtrC family, response regulator HydG
MAAAGASPGRQLLDLAPGVLNPGGAWSLDQLEQVLIEAAVEQAGGKLSAAARLPGMSRQPLAYRMRKFHDAGELLQRPSE